METGTGTRAERRGTTLKLLGFFLFLFGWFGLENYGFDLESFVLLIVGALMLGGLDAILKFEWRRNVKRKRY